MINKNIEILKKIAEDIQKKNGRMFYVGGYVRDKIIGIENKDIDVEVFGIFPNDLINILSKYGKVDQVGSFFGIFKIHSINIDFAMPRIEKNLGDKHIDLEVKVDPNMSTLEAARRRDFTMNSIMQDVLSLEIIDHFGGVKDIQNTVIRHIDENTFIQDELRVLRACQFAARLNFKIHKDTLKLCKRLDCTNLSKERIYLEVEKALLKSQKPSIFFEYINQIGILNKIFSPMDKLIGIKQNPKYHPEGDVWNHTLMVIDEASKIKEKSNYPIALMLAAVCHDLGKITTSKVLHGRIVSYNHENELHLTKKFLNNITSNNNLILSVMTLVKNHMRPNVLAKNNSSDKAVRKLIVEASSKSVNIYDLLLLAKADRMGRTSNDLNTYDIDQWWKDKLEKTNQNKSTIKPIITGKELLELGYNEGKELGEFLKFAFELQIKGLSKEKILEKLSKI